MTRAAATVTPRQRSGLSTGGISAWMRAHRVAMKDTLQQFARQPFMHLMTICVLAVTLAMPCGLYVMLKNIETLKSGWSVHETRMSVFLQTSVDEASAAGVANRLAATAGVANVQLITREQALEEYRAYSGFGEVIAALGANPLPAVIVLDPASGADLQALVTNLRDIPEVDLVKFDVEWVQRLAAISALAKRTVQIVAAALAIAVLFIAGSAIRASVVQRRDEIEVYKLVGATDAYIRRPFLYTAVIYGACGGLLASAIVLALLSGVERPVRELAALYQSNYQLTGLSWREVLAVTGGSGILGLIGAWWTAAQQVRRIDVR